MNGNSKSVFTRLMVLATIMALLLPFAVFADAATDQSIRINGTDGGTHAYTKSLSTSVHVSVLHCPPGGDLKALEVSFRNSPTDAWTIVHTGGTDWPGTDTDGCTASGDGIPATFNWTLASGSDGSRTVYAQFRHGTDIVSAQDGITLDATAPTIEDKGVTAGTSGSNGWYISAVTNRFTASDLGSGLADPSQADFTKSSGTDEGSAVTINSGPVSDKAGNTNPGLDSAPFKIDLTNPSVAITSPSDGSSTSDASTPVSGTASDSPSGIASVTLNGTAATLSAGGFSGSVSLACGANTITALATDNAGHTNSHQISVTRTCNNYSLSFLQPIDGSTTSNIVLNKGKNGRVVPVKVEIFQGGTELTSADVAAGSVTIGVSKMTSCSASSADAVESYADAGSSSAGTNAFRWSSDSPGFWIYNLDTAALKLETNACYRINVNLNGTQISTSQFAVFQPVK